MVIYQNPKFINSQVPATLGALLPSPTPHQSSDLRPPISISVLLNYSPLAKTTIFNLNLLLTSSKFRV